MLILHNIGLKLNSNYSTPEQVAATNERLSFDGVYENVWRHQHLLAKKRAGPTILFIMGKYVGGDNSFDAPMPPEKYCDWNQIMDLVIKYGCELGWHTWTHPNLTLLTDERLIQEITPPFPMKHFAYPYGNLNGRVVAAVEKAGYQEAWSVNEGDGTVFQRHRRYL